MPPVRSLLDHLPGLPRREPLPSLYDRHPRATTGLRRSRGIHEVPLEKIIGTVRHPSQNTVDFLPLPYLRGRNWSGRWQRIQQAVKKLSILPAIDVVKVGDEYYVADGHNRVAAALEVGAVAIDAEVTEIMLPGAPIAPEDAARHRDAHSLLLGADELRQAAAGRQSRTAEHRPRVDELRREELAQESETVADQEPE